MEAREFQFRAFVQSANGIPVGKMHYEKATVIWEWAERRGNAVRIMQFTGLEDKNGKRIYECDLLSYQSEGQTAVGHVLYENAMFKVKVEKAYQHTDDPSDRPYAVGDYVPLHQCAPQWAVIGNKYNA